jgi:hypothetical protein
MAGGFGNVYIFNLYAEEVTAFGLNGQPMSAGSIPGPAETTKPLYVPQQIIVSRTNLYKNQLNAPLFIQGDNSFTVDYQGQNWQGTVNIDPGTALSFDFWFYITFQTGWLLDTLGHFYTVYSEKTTVTGLDGKQTII